MTIVQVNNEMQTMSGKRSCLNSWFPLLTRRRKAVELLRLQRFLAGIQRSDRSYEYEARTLNTLPSVLSAAPNLCQTVAIGARSLNI